LTNIRDASQSQATEGALDCTTLWVKNFGLKGNVYDYAGHTISRHTAELDHSTESKSQRLCRLR